MHPFSRDRKKSATILHAVPETTQFAAALLVNRRDTSTHGNQDDSRTPIPDFDASSSPREEKIAIASPKQESRSVLSGQSLKSAIGVYKHGKIQWRQKDRARSKSERKATHDAVQNSRPKIKVVIPNVTLDRPLPALPSFPYSSRQHITSAMVTNDAHDVSPPSANNEGIMRYSIVSPITHSYQGPLGHSQHAITHVGRRASVPVPKQQQNPSVSSTSSHDSFDSDASSVYSEHSSETSVEEDKLLVKKSNARKHAHHISIISPVIAGVFDASPEQYTKEPTAPSLAPPRHYDGHATVERDFAYQSTCPLGPARKKSGNLGRRSTIKSKSSNRLSSRRSLTPAGGAIDQAISRSTSRQLSNPGHDSPTLSEAENDLEEHLTSFKEELKLGKSCTVTKESRLSVGTETNPFQWEDVMEQKNLQESPDSLRAGSATDDAPNVPPALPRKSSKRQSVTPSESTRMSRVSHGHIASQINRGRPLGSNPRLTVTIPEFKKMSEDSKLSPTQAPPRSTKRNITPICAEGVILNIFRSLDHFDDLFATAVVNRGFYRVFKRYELELLKSTLNKMSPAIWEFREITKGHDMLQDEDLEMTRPIEEYTPAAYLHMQKRDIHVIREIKWLIKERCQSFVRPEISIALISDNSAASSRVDDALWRIWTFCKIFGSGKGRENDIVAQQDWLKGGAMVHQPACTFSITSTDYMNDTFVSAPECFGKGNEDGLGAEQLFDMMELWNCLGVLLQGFAGRTAQAREHGIYDCTEIRGGDIDGEETMLDEWCYHLLTFGLSTVLELAGPSQELSPSAFKLAKQNGWLNWKPPVFGGTRRNFFKEAASRVYEDKIAPTYATTSTRDIQRQMSKQRIQGHISELRDRRNNGLRAPIISMSQERPMSEWSTVIGNLTRPQTQSTAEDNIVSHIPSFGSSFIQDIPLPVAELSRASTPSPQTRSSSPRRTVAQPLLPSPPPSTVPSTRDRTSIAASMPPISEHPAFRNHPSALTPAPLAFSHTTSHARQYSAQSTYSHRSVDHPAFTQHPMQYDIYASQAHENTAEKAIYRIVDMGFTADQAREALRMTDMGDGLRVDRAVDLLLSRV